MSNQNVVSVNIMGGLGNQMFQLASTYAYAKKFNGNLKILRNKRQDDGRPLYWESILKNFTKYLVDSIPIDLNQWYEKYSTEYYEIPALTAKGIYINGYLQSPKYFNDIKNDIKELFKPSQEMFDLVYNKYKPLIDNKDRIIVVHARRTDYVKSQQMIDIFGPLTVEYYKTAMKQISSEVSNPIFLLVSDDSQFWVSVIKEVSELSENNTYILDNEDEINTLILLQQFKYFIIANSTFSWWAAWLSDYKKVIAPSKWFGPNGPLNYKDIYITDWQLI
jgi:hypothetical protein